MVLQGWTWWYAVVGWIYGRLEQLSDVEKDQSDQDIKIQEGPK